MSRVHLTISLDPHNATEAEMLKRLHLLSSFVNDEEMTKDALESELKYLLMGGYYLSKVSPAIPERLAHHLVEPDLEVYLRSVLGVMNSQGRRDTPADASPSTSQSSFGASKAHHDRGKGGEAHAVSNPSALAWGDEKDATLLSSVVDKANSPAMSPSVLDNEPDLTLSHLEEMDAIKASNIF